MRGPRTPSFYFRVKTTTTTTFSNLQYERQFPLRSVSGLRWLSVCREDTGARLSVPTADITV